MSNELVGTLERLVVGSVAITARAIAAADAGAPIHSVATLIAVFGVFMTPLGWGRALFVWGYALAWFLLNDRIRLFACRLLDPVGDDPPTAAARPNKQAGSLARAAQL